ncbi:MAG: CBS domain-containing protein [Planctomycetes bacterium]|nr:CBS domain-containing protein [Planctomycetota bacterium]
MIVANHCRRSVSRVTRDATVERIARILRDDHVGSVVVVDDDHPVGIVTDRDIAVRVLAEGRDPRRTRVGEILSRPLRTVAMDAPFQEAAAAMARHGVRRIVVVTKEGRLYGVLSIDDLLVRYARQFGAIGRAVRQEQARESRRGGSR